MAKLFFRYSSMGAGKTLDLLKVAFNYEENGENILLFTSSKDYRYGKDVIKSRTGLSKDAISISDETNILDVVLLELNSKRIKAILVDESQFLTKKHIYQLSDVVDKLNIPVICYGLRSDFMLEPFVGSLYLLTMADSIEEIKTICAVCKDKKAIINSRIYDGFVVTEGEQVEIGGNDTYKPMCRKCFKEERRKSLIKYKKLNPDNKFNDFTEFGDRQDYVLISRESADYIKNNSEGNLDDMPDELKKLFD